KSWPQAYRTPIGAGGRALSAGQRQRLGLARALYRRPKLILLDEPNANLDDEGQKALREALVQAKAWSATIIMVTHHLGILQIADRVIRMEEGRVVADETGQEVLQRLKSIALRREGTVQQDPKPRLPGADPTVSANDRAKGQAE
ncbi:MAG: ATP-binding cassette domain-containing protein, partial [Pseudomonadota bacterium]